MTEKSVVEFRDPGGESDVALSAEATTLIHFTEDGFTAHGKVWYRGQELEYVKDSGAYGETLDRAGHSWLDDDDAAQMHRYGRVMFRHGPWPGAGYSDEAAEAAERRRRRVPPLSTPLPVSGRE